MNTQALLGNRSYLLLFVISLSLVFLSACSSNPPTEGNNLSTPVNNNIEEVAPEEVEDLSNEQDDGMTVFRITGENFKFLMDGVEAPELRVALGEKVRIEFESTSGFHDWVVDEFDAGTEPVSEGNSSFVEFVADREGTFEYYCSVGSHREMGMVGKLVVTE